MPKRIVFLTGTRADFGKLKSLMQRLEDHEDFEVQIFVTGMHMLRRYGYTCAEVERSGFQNIFCKFFSQNPVQKGNPLRNCVTIWALVHPTLQFECFGPDYCFASALKKNG